MPALVLTTTVVLKLLHIVLRMLNVLYGVHYNCLKQKKRCLILYHLR